MDLIPKLALLPSWYRVTISEGFALVVASTTSIIIDVTTTTVQTDTKDNIVLVDALRSMKFTIEKAYPSLHIEVLNDDSEEAQTTPSVETFLDEIRNLPKRGQLMQASLTFQRPTGLRIIKEFNK